MNRKARRAYEATREAEARRKLVRVTYGVDASGDPWLEVEVESHLEPKAKVEAMHAAAAGLANVIREAVDRLEAEVRP